MTDKSAKFFLALLAAALMALAANCFLSYLWWTACYSAWQGIPKMAEQWQAAGSRATFNGWSMLALDASAIAVLYSLIRLRDVGSSGFVKACLRMVLSLTIAIAGTAVFSLGLSWIKQGFR